MAVLRPVLLCLAAVLVFAIAEVVHFATGPQVASPSAPQAPVVLVAAR